MGPRLWHHVVRDHLLLGGIAALVMAPWLGAGGALIFWVVTVFMDVDHHLMFIWRSGWRNLFRVDRMLRYVRALFETKPDQALLALDPLHTVEVLAVVYGLSVRWPAVWLQAIWWGCLLHFVTDIVHQVRHGRPFTRAYSIVEYAIRRRRLVASGFSPDRLLQQAVSSAILSP